MGSFDSVAHRYDAACATPVGTFIEIVEQKILKELLNPCPGERIVDLGCGTGTNAVWMAEAGCEVVGVDESEPMLAQARRKTVARGGVEWVRGDLARLSCSSASFDAGLMQVTLEFVRQAEAALTEALRVIKPGGRLVLGLIQGTGAWARYYQERARADPDSVYYGAHFWTLGELIAVMGWRPACVRGGLYVGPEEFVNAAQAEALEDRYRLTRPLQDAGFLAVRYDRALSDSEGRILELWR
ncbi:MAG: methyltransferase domain-containing protein [Thermaerobacter sp.]|nr:methyltransferase domain-containing protein [Thermaerobacter sp.]